MKPRTCAFCGEEGKLTSEHIFGDWLTHVGINMVPSRHGAGPINRSARDLGVSLPFTRKVRDVCAGCNNGWMSNLETAAARVLTPLVLGNLGSISDEDTGAIAAWVQKTALVGMFVSSEDERANGYGLPQQEYRELYELRQEVAPLPASQFWIGRYQGRRYSSIWVTPMVVKVNGLEDPDLPYAYAMTIVIGEVIFHGVRFTAPSVQLDLRIDGLEKMWPKMGTVTMPHGSPIDDVRFERLSKGLNLVSRLNHVLLVPWRPAADLPDSEPHGPLVRVPTPCGKHVVFYPNAIAVAGISGDYCAFATSCECGTWYLIQTEEDGAHFKAEGNAEGIAALYNGIPGNQLFIQDDAGKFVFKCLAR